MNLFLKKKNPVSQNIRCGASEICDPLKYLGRQFCNYKIVIYGISVYNSNILYLLIVGVWRTMSDLFIGSR